MIVRASSGTTSRFISQDKSGQKRPRKPNSRAAPLCASSKERGRHYRLFILRRETECSCSGIKRDTWSSNTRHPHRPPIHSRNATRYVGHTSHLLRQPAADRPTHSATAPNRV